MAGVQDEIKHGRFRGTLNSVSDSRVCFMYRYSQHPEPSGITHLTFIAIQKIQSPFAQTNERLASRLYSRNIWWK